MKGLIYTAIFGKRDKPRPIKPEDGVRYLMFTDGPGAAGWEVKPAPWTVSNTRMTARIIKTGLPLSQEAEDRDWTLWVDASHTPKVPLKGLVEEWLRADAFAAFKHPWRNCTYAEIEACIKLKLPGNLEFAKRQLEENGFPKDWGLAATGVLARLQCGAVKLHAQRWLADVLTLSVRDQISFMPLLRHLSGQPHWIEGHGSVYDSDLFTFHGHEQ